MAGVVVTAPESLAAAVEAAALEPAVLHAIAQAVGEKHRPAYVEERRKRGRRPEGVNFEDWYEEVEVPSPGADGVATTTFRAEDDCLSIRCMTWDEIVPLVMSAALASGAVVAADGVQLALQDHWKTMDRWGGEMREVCGRCRHGDGVPFLWPCPTRQAITGEPAPDPRPASERQETTR